MEPQKRIQMILLLEKMKKEKAYSEKLGLKDKSHYNEMSVSRVNEH